MFIIKQYSFILNNYLKDYWKTKMLTHCARHATRFEIVSLVHCVQKTSKHGKLYAVRLKLSFSIRWKIMTIFTVQRKVVLTRKISEVITLFTTQR